MTPSVTPDNQPLLYADVGRIGDADSILDTRRLMDATQAFNLLTWKWEREEVENRRAQHNNHPNLKIHSDLVDLQTASISNRGQLTFE